MHNKKKKKRILLFVAAMSVILVLLATYLVCFAEDNRGYRTISVVEYQGTVSVVKDGIEYSAYPGMVLQEGHEIITAANSYVRLVLDDDKYVKLEPGSKMIFETLGITGSNKTKLKLERGSMSTEIVKTLESDAEYIVVVPNAVFAVRGTFFHVDLSRGTDGEIITNIMTYGGSVASQRILPSGEVVQEEVLIEAGYRAGISMDTAYTVYVVEGTEGALDSTGDGLPDVEPIEPSDIPDGDMPDIYFASINGHKLFMATEETIREMEARGIDYTELISVYEKAASLLMQNVSDSNQLYLIDVSAFANDNRPLAKEGENDSEYNATGINIPALILKTIAVTQGIMTDGNDSDVHEHSYTAEITKKATCTLEGEKTFTCSCGDTYTEIIVKTDHKYESSVTKEASCTDAGIMIYECICGDFYTEEISMADHTQATGGTADIHSKCGVCHTTLLGGNAHSYTDIMQTAGCTTGGLRTYTCSCGYSYSDEIEATGHLYMMSIQEATCTSAGVKTYTCGCGASYTETIEALGHDYATEFTVDAEATCTEAGSKSRHCSRCAATTEATEIAATGHSYGAWEEVTAAACETEGRRSRICSVCRDEETEAIEALSHDYATEFTIDTEATCTEAGSQSRHCSRCTATTEVTEIAATGHSYGAWEEVTAAACETEGNRSRVCSVCRDEETEAIEALGHDYATEFTIDTEATCTEAGSQSRHCSNCDSTTEVTEIAATGHNYGAWEEVTAAACETEGSRSRICSVCQDEETEAIEALGHDYATKFTVDAEATCTEAGSQSRHCSNCDSTTEVTEIAATGHDYISEVTKESTCSEAGEHTYTCDCGYSYTEDIEILPHTATYGGEEDVHTKCSVCNTTITDGSSHEYTAEVTKESTCSEEGERTYTCDCGYSYTEDIAMLSHTAEYGGEEDIHTKCSVCDTTIMDGSAHEYTSEVTKEATCTEVGECKYTCSCGYSYTEEVDALGHTEISGGEEDVHTKCDVCGITLSETHNFTEEETIEATCTADGELTYDCECGYKYTEVIPAAHKKADENATATECKYCGAAWVELSAANFPDVNFLTYVTDEFDQDGDGILFDSEITSVNTISVSGTEASGGVITDGGITDLTGVEYFTELTTLNCAYNSGLTALNLTGCTALTNLDVTGCSPTLSIDLSESSPLYADYADSIIGYEDTMSVY